MRPCVLYVVLFMGYSAQPDSHEFGHKKPSGSPQDSNPVIKTRVIGGQPTLPGEIPSMAAIGYEHAGKIHWKCGGSLISRNFVLSAAHCTRILRKNIDYGLARWVRLGGVDLRSDTEGGCPQRLKIVERVVHPGYRKGANYNDLVLFRIDRDVKLDNFVRPVCLHSDIGDPSGSGTVAGWGYNETNGFKSPVLLQVDIKFVPAEECKGLVPDGRLIPNGIDTDTMICALESGKGACNGDSGGPLLLPATSRSARNCFASLVGVTSFGPRRCGLTSIPGVYVRVAHFRPWIESVVWPD